MPYRSHHGLLICPLFMLSCTPSDTTDSMSSPVDMGLTASDDMNMSRDIGNKTDMRRVADMRVTDMRVQDMPDTIPCVDYIGRDLTCTASPFTPGKWCCPPGPESCDAPPIGGAISPGGVCDNASWDVAPVDWFATVDEHGCTVLIPGDESCLIPPDMGDDMPEDMRPDLPPPPTWDFTLVNVGTEPLFIQQGTTDEFGHWKVLRDGEVLPTGNRCEICDCASCSQCIVCGRAIHDVIRLDPGDRRGFNWDRLIWQRQGNSCSQSGYECETSSLAPSAQYVMRVTYSRSFVVDMDIGVTQRLIGEPLVIDTPFALPFDEPFEIDLE